MKRILLILGVALCLSSPAAAQEIKLAWKDHPSLRAGDWLRVDFRARVQSDVRRSPLDEVRDDTEAARQRVGIEGRVGSFVDYQLEYEIGAKEWRDVYIDYRQFKPLQVQAGTFKVPFGLEETTS